MPATFKEFWDVYPKRKGSRAIAEAEKKFNLYVKKGADPDHILSSAFHFRESMQEQDLVDTQFIPLASTWLNQKRWLDYPPDAEAKIERDKRLDIFMIEKGYIWNGQRWEKVEKTPRNGGSDPQSPDGAANVTS